MEYMKAIAVMGPNDIGVVGNVPKPVLGDYEALVKVHACGFCNGTDMQIITGTGGDLGNGVSIYPTVLGHEGAGEIVAVGKKVRHIHVGERWIHPNLYPDVGNGYTKTHGSRRNMAWSAIIRRCWKTASRKRTFRGSSSINSPIP